MSEPVALAAIVLAAGRGTRFGPDPKLLAPLGGKPLVRHAVDAALAAGLAPVLVVTGHRADAVRAACQAPDVGFVANPDFAEGLSTSLRAGFAALPPGVAGAFVLLGDMPLVGAGLLARLSAAWREAGCPSALVPMVEGRPGNPVLLSRALSPDIAALRGDAGAGPLLRGRPDVVRFPLEDRALAVDVDTRATLDLLRSTGVAGQAANTTPSSTAP